MSLYYFHLRSGDRLYGDAEGSDLSDIEDARLEAIVSARQLMAENLRRGQALKPRVFEVADDRGAVVARVDFADVLRAAIELEA